MSGRGNARLGGSGSLVRVQGDTRLHAGSRSSRRLQVAPALPDEHLGPRRQRRSVLRRALGLDDPEHDLHCDKVIERPKVIYNQATKKFVMWLHVDSVDYKAARSAVAVSDRPTGPFKYLGSFRPNAGVW